MVNYALGLLQKRLYCQACVLQDNVANEKGEYTNGVYSPLTSL